MPNFNIIKNNNIEKTFRVAKVMSDFDVKIAHSNEHFEGNIDIPKEWNIGLIVGGSGTGKTTIINELFKDNIITNFD
jgi:ABC-type transporter Mla maintaining outer membrane lipid asymmetry ATPase subunit MlaF